MPWATPSMVQPRAQAQLGHIEEARKAAERIQTEFPSFTVDGYIRDFPVTAPEALAAISGGCGQGRPAGRQSGIAAPRASSEQTEHP